MRTLNRAVATLGGSGAKLTLPWHALNQLVTLRTNELVILAGAPGGGKSMVAVNMAMEMQYPILYFAQDSPNSILARMGAIATGRKTSEVASAFEDPEVRGRLAHRLEGHQNPMLIFNRGAVTIDQLEQKVHAMREWAGMYPPLVFIDNLIDMIVPGVTHTETTFYATILPQLKQMCNENDMTIIGLHHVTRGGGSETSHGTGTRPIKMNDLLFAGEREARHVWGVFHPAADEHQLQLQILKQQDGPADPDGGLRVGLRWFPEHGRITSYA